MPEPKIEIKEDSCLTPDEQRIIIELFKLGASNFEASLDSGIDVDKIIFWRVNEGNDEAVKLLQAYPVWQAKKLFHSPKTHGEAESTLKRHPLSKADYAEIQKQEHSGHMGIHSLSDEELKKRAAEIIGQIL